jgi:hypothetical protein
MLAIPAIIPITVIDWFSWISKRRNENYHYDLSKRMAKAILENYAPRRYKSYEPFPDSGNGNVLIVILSLRIIQ